MTYWYEVYFEGLEGSAFSILHDRIVAHAFECTRHSIHDWDKSLDEDTMIVHFRREDDALLFMQTFEEAQAAALRLSGNAGPLYLGGWAYAD